MAAIGLAAPLPTTTRAAPTHLSVDSKGERIAYASNRSVFLRSLADPSKCVQYTQHTQPVNVAKFSPSGYYVASGDAAGNVRIWDCAGEDQVLKSESKPISDIRDLDWDGESQRVIAVGNGRERFGHAFTYDSANSVGEISGHSQTINAVTVRQQRPFRAATASDDGTIVFLHGAPYKYNKTIRTHSKFVYDVRFSPDGAYLASAGADGKLFLYDGKTGDTLGEFEDAKTGSIFAISWDPTSKLILTASADQTARVWDVEKKACVETWQLAETGGNADAVTGQQVGCLWTAKHIISLSLGGNLAFLERGKSEPVQRIYGHQRAITALGKTEDRKHLLTGSYDGGLCAWDAASLTAAPLEGEGHTGQAVQFATAGSSSCSVGFDDTLRILDGTKYTKSISLASQPKGVGAASGVIAVATESAVELYGTAGEKLGNLQIDSYRPTAVAVSPKGDIVAVGADGVVELFDLAGGKLTPRKKLTNSRTIVSALSFSADGAHLAAGESSGKIVVYGVSDGSAVTSRWAFHVGRVTALAWHPAGDRCASTALDTHVYVWSLSKPAKKHERKNAHQGGATGCAWTGHAELVTSGADGTLKKWEIPAI